jgi:hypothetical protein
LPKATVKPARLALAALWLCGPPACAEPLEYLYVEAGEESASGGHAALKLGDEVFHFQHVPPGLLRARRDDFAQFRRQYGERENRTIHRHRVEVSAETFALLRERFNRVRLVEDEQFDRRDGLARDVDVLALLLRGDRAEGLELQGLGLFFADGWDYAAPPPAARRRAVAAGAAGRGGVRRGFSGRPATSAG